jgi:hypothetical protein
MQTKVLFDYIRYGARKHLEALWHLQGDHGGVVFADMEYGFMNFKGIIGR